MKRRVVLAIAVVAAVFGLVTPGTATAAGKAAAGKAAANAANAAGEWNRIFQAPRAAGMFTDIVAISKSNVWAVGQIDQGRHQLFQPYIRHFDGSGWQAVTIPGARGFASESVAASSASNVWILGPSTSLTFVTTVYRYDGARWHRVPVPAQTILEDPVVLGPANVWAFGLGDTGTNVFHWNGTSWHAYTLNLFPEALSASAWNNVWVAGLTRSGRGRATAYRWNGARWLPVAMPHPVIADFPGAAVFSPSDVWIGWETGVSTTTAIHWNGHSWHAMSVSDIGANPSNIVPDGRGGDWFGPLARWTGHDWISTFNFSPESASGGLGPVVRIPGTSSFLLAAGVANVGSTTEHPTIYRFDLT
jgi:hypothetical protein